MIWIKFARCRNIQFSVYVSTKQNSTCTKNINKNLYTKYFQLLCSLLMYQNNETDVQATEHPWEKKNVQTNRTHMREKSFLLLKLQETLGIKNFFDLVNCPCRSKNMPSCSKPVVCRLCYICSIPSNYHPRQYKIETNMLQLHIDWLSYSNFQ